MITAEQINAHLANDGIVQVFSHNHATNYTKKHAGWFSQGNDGNLYVRRGKGKDCLTFNAGRNALVTIRTFNRVAAN